MENKFFLTNAIEKIERGESSVFLDPKEQKEVRRILQKKGIPYSVFEPYPGAEKVLFYRGQLPDMELLEIVSKVPLEHRSIMGVFFAHQILPYFYSDIMITDTHYVVALKPVATYLKNHVHEIGKNTVQIVARDQKLLMNFKPKFETMILHVSSLRLDAVLAKLLRVSRKNILEKIDAKEVFLNYEECLRKEILLKNGDVFSVRRYGKFVFKEIIYQNKKGNMDIEIEKYQ